MSANAKSALSTLKTEFRTAAISFLKRRSTITHAIAFTIGLLIGVFCFGRSPVTMAETAVSEAADEPEAAVSVLPQYNSAPSQYQTDYDAVCVARVLYGIRDYHLSRTCKRAVIEVIKNRVADQACEFRAVNTVQAVCEQPNQWQGYEKDGEYLKEDYDLALEVLYDTSGARTVPEGCYFLVVEYGSVTVRTKWKGGNEWSVK